MTSMITEGVQVSVETFYQEDYSNPMQGEYMFAYRVEIERALDEYIIEGVKTTIPFLCNFIVVIGSFLTVMQLAEKWRAKG